MKQIVAHLLLLLALLVTVSGQDTSSVRGRVQAQMKQWASVLAHCAEASNTEGQIEAEAALECKRCQAGVGDWNNPEGFQRGKACLETWEPRRLWSARDARLVLVTGTIRRASSEEKPVWRLGSQRHWRYAEICSRSMKTPTTT